MERWKNLWYETRRIWPILLVIAAAVFWLGDVAQLKVQVYTLSMVGLVVWASHLVRKAMFPYLDMSTMVRKGSESPVGAAIIFAAVIALLSVIIVASAANAMPPDRSRPLLPVLAKIEAQQWPGIVYPQVPAGQVEQESSWKKRAELRTSREHGRGLVQLTIAYRDDGSERFNSYREAVASFQALATWDWQAEPYRVDYQLTYLVLQDRANAQRVRALGIVDPAETWKAALVCYNAGPGRVLKRRAYALARGLPAERWSGGLDQAHGPAEDRILYGRPLWQAVNEYPLKIFRRAAGYPCATCHGDA